LAVGDVRASHSALRGVEVPAGRVAAMIDELPILAVAAAFANGPTRVSGAAELRVKESDRIAGVAALLAGAGAAVEARADGFTIAGRGRGERAPAGGGLVQAGGDHRIAMAALVMGLASRAPIEIDDGRAISTSFPAFEPLMRGLGAELGRLGPAGGRP